MSVYLSKKTTSSFFLFWLYFFTQFFYCLFLASSEWFQLDEFSTQKNFRNKAETVSSLSDLYPVGSFAQIIEFRDLGAIVEVILSAQRRIRILESVDDSAPDGTA